MRRVTISVRCAAVVAEQTLREALRQRLLLLLAAMAAALVGAAYWLRDLNLGSPESRFLLDADFGAQWVFGAVLAVAATAHLFFAELDRRTAFMVLARPVRRSEYVAGKLGGVLILLLGFCGLLTALLLALLWARDGVGGRPAVGAISDGSQVALVDVACGGLVVWLRLGVLASMTLLVASFARSQLFTMLAGFFLLVAGQLQHLLGGYVEPSSPPWVRGLAGLCRTALPDFEFLNVSDRVAAGEPLSGELMRAVTGYALGYIAVFAVLAAFSFRHREL